MSATCTDNSTECLLRILIETTANQTSPWEPRSFGFTVAIGVAAFLISFIAIFQGLLAAGPGRIKASSNAIGAFSRLTKGKLSWIEFAWRSTAYVPFINYDDLREGLKRQSPGVPHGTNYPFNAGSINTGATWLQLFRAIGLNEEVEQIFHGVLQPCATDHLPADIQAPPVSISIHCMAILAAIADPTTILEQGDRFVAIRGRISQVSFREHPVLGTIGGYERYQTKMPLRDAKLMRKDPMPHNNRFDKYISGARQLIHRRPRTYEQPISETETIVWVDPDPTIKPFATLGRCTPLALDLAHGYLRLNYGMCAEDKKMHVVSFTYGTPDCTLYTWHSPNNAVPQPRGSNLSHPFVRALALMVAQTDYEVRPFPWKQLQLDTAIEYLRMNLQWLFADQEAFEKYMTVGEGYTYSRGYSERNPLHDSLFEWRGSWIVDAPAHTDIGGDFGWDVMSKIYRNCVAFLKDIGPNGNGQKSETEDTTHLWMGPDSTLWYTLKHVDILLKRKRTQAMKALDAMTKKMVDNAVAEEAQSNTANPELHNRSRSGSPSPSASRESTVDVSSQLSRTSIDAGVDITLQEPHLAGTEPVTAGMVSGSSTTSLVQASPEPAKPTVEPPERTEEVYLEALLAVRAILFAALLKRGTDTSMLLEPDFKDAVVKII